MPPEIRTSDISPGVVAADLTTIVRAAEVPPVGRMETVQPEMPTDSVPMSPDSPQTVAFNDMAGLSVPMSPNRVREENSQDVPDEGTVFEVSPDTSGFCMRPSGAGMQLHHLWFLEFIGAPESARLLYHSPACWVQCLREEDALAADVNLQRDAGFMLSNLEILSQFVTSMHRMSTEMMSLNWVGKCGVPF